MFFSIDIQCSECGHVWDEVILKSEKDRKDFPCPNCEKEAGHRIPSAPNSMKRALPDGTKRAGFQKLREQDAIERQMENTRSGKDKLKMAQERDRIYQKKS